MKWCHGMSQDQQIPAWRIFRLVGTCHILPYEMHAPQVGSWRGENETDGKAGHYVRSSQVQWCETDLLRYSRAAIDHNID